MRELIKQKVAAAYIGRSEKTLARLRKSGQVAFYRFGRDCLYDRYDLDAFLRRHLHNAEASAQAQAEVIER